jgi:hypothetical protein
MTHRKANAKAASRSSVQKIVKPTSRNRLQPKSTAPSDTKHARVVAMLRKPGGATIKAIMAVTKWQQHSVRGFLAGIVRKKLGLNLVSDLTEKGRVYRIKEGKSSPVSADRAKQAA